MNVDWLALSNFRSYESLEWRPDPGVNVLIGRNGAGKTNLLESVAYMASLRSFRSAPDAAMIADDQDEAVIRAGIAGEGRERLIEISVSRQGHRRVQVDKSKLRRSADLLGVVRVVAFLPEDLDLIKRGPAKRRDLIDDIAIQLWPAAYLDQSEYDRALRQRNAFLKSGDRDESTLAVWDSRLAQSGGRVMARRAKVITTLAPHLSKAYDAIAAMPARAGFIYEPAWWQGSLGNAGAGAYADAIAKGLESSRSADYERRMTTLGPHRDEPGFTIEDHPARTHGSQGEQRTLALAVKLAAHRSVAENVGEPPVLLLDDVFSELDPQRSSALAEALPADSQTIITSARPEDVPIAGSSWAVEDGTIS